MSLDNPTKLCPTCQQSLPATLEFFGKDTTDRKGVRLLAKCKTCMKQYKYDNARANRMKETAEQKELRLAKARAYDKANPEKGRAKRRRQYIAHSERIRAYTRAYYTMNKVEILSKRKGRYINDAEFRAKEINRTREWANNNPQKIKVMNKRSHNLDRAKNYDRVSNLTTGHIEQMYEDQDGRCFYCGIPILWELNRDIHTDHIVPFAKGGHNTPENVVLACQDCNAQKSDKTLEEWQRVRGW